MLELGELGEELPREQVRWRHDLAVPDADDAAGRVPIRLQERPVLVPGDERLIGEREHRGVVVANARPPCGTSCPCRSELGVDGMPAAQAVERGDDLLVLVSHDHQHIIEPGFRDLPHRPPDQRLAAERQQEFGGAHPRRCAGREDDGGHHGVIVAAAVLR